MSVILNIGEGASRKSKLERRRFYEIARGSLVEIDAAIEIAVNLTFTTPDTTAKTGELLLSCFKRLSKMIQSLSE